MGKNSSRNPLWPDWFDGEKIDEVTFCHELIRNHPMKCIENHFFTPDGPVEDEAELKQLILKEIQAFIIHGLSKKVSNLLESLRIIAYLAPLDIEVDCIHLKNGIYHLADGTFQESRLFCRNRLPVAYNPKAAKPERWLAFLNELLEPEDIPTLQEYLGYCLIPCTKGQKMMFLLGKGGEGKSRIGLVLKNLMGDAVSNGSIQKVETSRFARADLENRLLMVDDDMRMEALRQTNYVKSIVTAQGQMDLERKGKQSYQGWMYARLLAFSNGDLQALYDRSDGFYRRQLILTTKDKPLSRVDDPDIAEKMAAEIEGILLWAFEGLQRLVKNGFQFTESDRAKRNRELVKRDNNNVFDFLESEGYIRLKADACTSSKELYEVYRMWCEENSLNAIKARGFSDALIANQRRYNLESTNNIVNSSGRRVRGFVGIEALVQPDLAPNNWRA